MPVTICNLSVIHLVRLHSVSRGQGILNDHAGANHAAVSISDIGFNAGKHAMSVIINAPDFSKSYCRFDNAGFLNMASNFASGAHLLIPAKWENTL